MSLGYGNFVNVVRYDIYAMAEAFVAAGHAWSVGAFQSSRYSLDLSKFEYSHIYNSPNLSIFPLLAYHKICNDHYRNEKWQPFEPWTCNIDYLRPQDNMNAHSFISGSPLKTLVTSILDLENSNLPLDYFTSVLPLAQYGDESAVPIGNTASDITIKLSDGADKTIGVMFGESSYSAGDTLLKANSAPTPYDGSYVSKVTSTSTGSTLVGLHGKVS